MDATYVSRSRCVGHIQPGACVPNCDLDGDSSAGLLEAGEASANNSAYVRRPAHFATSTPGKADSAFYFADKKGRDGHTGMAAVLEQVRQVRLFSPVVLWSLTPVFSSPGLPSQTSQPK